MSTSVALNGPDFEYDVLPDYQLIIREFAFGMIEMVQRRINFMDELRRSRGYGIRGVNRPIETPEEEAARKHEENLRRAERRARQQVRHRILSIGADHLLTLTYRENQTDSDQLNTDFTKFIRLVRQKYPEWLYVAVKEYQERGALHMHVACVGKQDIEHLRKCWYLALGADEKATGDSTPGAVNVRYKKKRFSGQSPIYSALQLAAYLSKYISKTFATDHELGERRYKSSRGIPQPKVSRQYLGAFAAIHKEESFPTAAKETIAIAQFIGVQDMQLWAKPDLSIMVVRGAI